MIHAATSIVLRRALGALAMALMVTSLGCDRGESFADAQRETEAWRTKHENDYRRDWATVAGLYFLEPGAHSAGSAPTNQIVLPPDVPATLGRFVLDGEAVRFEPETGTDVRLRDQVVREPVVLKDDGAADVDELSIGDIRMVIHRSGPRKTLRVWDPDGAQAKGFQGFRWFDIQPAYRVVGTFIPDPAPRTARVVNTFGPCLAIALPNPTRIVVNANRSLQ